MQPALAISYSGDSTDGALGVGFSLQGLSIISRCTPIRADGSRDGPIKFDDTDTLCLDGDPLIRASDGTYRTRHESFTEISIQGHDGLGPISFLARSKDGLLHYYGTNGNSRLETSRISLTTTVSTDPKTGASNVTVSDSYPQRVRVAWAVSEVSDRNGNVIVFGYKVVGTNAQGELTCSGTNQPDCPKNGVEQLIDTIRYTSNPNLSLAGDRTVTFQWGPMKKPADRWTAGVHLPQRHILLGIEMRAPAPSTPALVRQYGFKYNPFTSATVPLSPAVPPDPDISGRDKLSEIDVCDGSGACQAPITFAWQSNSIPRTVVAAVKGDTNNPADFDYPGVDYSIQKKDRPQRDILWQTTEQWGHGEVLVLDANGDGYDDLLYRTRVLSEPAQHITGQAPKGGAATPEVRLAFQYRIRLSNGKTLGRPMNAGIADVTEESALSWYPQCETAALKQVPGGDSELAQATYQNCAPGMPVAVDVDMDGAAEVHDGWRLYRWKTGTPGPDGAPTGVFEQVTSGFAPAGGLVDQGNAHVVVGDFFGDNYSELLSLDAFRMEANDAGTLSGASANDAYILPHHPLGSAYVYDPDGSGHIGLLAQANSADPVYSNLQFGRDASGTPFEVPSAASLPVSDGFALADANGDGLDDAFYFGGDFAANTGNGFAPVTIVSSSAQWSYAVTDEDRDGRVDSKVFPGVLVNDTDQQVHALLDINGDGLLDSAFQADVDQGLSFAVSQWAPNDVVIAVDDGGGHLDLRYDQATQRSDDPACLTERVYCLSRARTFVTQYAWRHADAPGLAEKIVDVTWDSPLFGLAGRGFYGYGHRKETEEGTGGSVDYSFDNFDHAFFDGYSGNLIAQSETTPLGDGRSLQRITQFSYDVVQSWNADDAPRLLRLRTSKEDVAQLEVDGSQTPIESSTTSLVYDDFGNVRRRETDWNLAHVTRVVTITYQNDTTTWLIGLPHEITLTATDAQGNVERRAVTDDYDGAGHLTNQHVSPGAGPPLEAEYVAGYDDAGLLSFVLESGSGTTRITESISYDAREHMFPVARTNALGQTWRAAWEPSFGLPATVVDENGATTKLQYDGFARVRTVTAPDGNVATASYQAASSGMTITHAQTGGLTNVAAVDAIGRTISARVIGVDTQDRIVDYAYGDTRFPLRPTFVSNPHFAADAPIGETLTYDGLGRTLQVQHADGSVVATHYDGLSTSIVDEVGRQRAIQRDELGRIVESVQVAGLDELKNKPTLHTINTQYVWSALSLLKQVIDTKGNVSTRAYDPRGRLIHTSDPDAGDRTIAYDALGEITDAYDGNGVHTTYARDALGRVVGLLDGDGVRCFQWDATNGIGRLAETRLAGITTSYAYDAIGRLTESTWDVDGESFQVGLRYAANGQVGRIEYPGVANDQLLVDLLYDGHGQLESVGVPDGVSGKQIKHDLYWTIHQRDVWGNVVDRSYGDGNDDRASFRLDRGFLQSVETDVAGSPIRAQTFDYFPDGRLKTRADGILKSVEQFGYDQLGELTHWESEQPLPKAGTSNVSVDYEYDDLGNLTRRTENANGIPTAVRYGVDATHPHQLASDTSQAGAFLYDGNGNQFEAPNRSALFNGAGLPTLVVAGTNVAQFKYDAMDHRIRKDFADGQSTLTLGPYERRTAADGGFDHVFYVPGGVQVTWHEVNGKITSKQTSFVLGDQLGSTSVVSDAKGNVLDRRRFEPFGKRIKPSDPSRPDTTPASLVTDGFTGQPQDDDLGLVNMQGRIYDPNIARFITPDPIVPDPTLAVAYNRYAYVLNDPTNLVDPSGFDPDGGVGWGVCDGSGGCGEAGFTFQDSYYGGGYGYEANALTGAPAPLQKTPYAPEDPKPKPVPPVGASYSSLPGMIAGSAGSSANGNDNRTGLVNVTARNGDVVTVAVAPFIPGQDWLDSMGIRDERDMLDLMVRTMSKHLPDSDVDKAMHAVGRVMTTVGQVADVANRVTDVVTPLNPFSLAKNVLRVTGHDDAATGVQVGQDVAGIVVTAGMGSPTTAVETEALVAEQVPQLGGGYSNVRRTATEMGLGGEVHHMPSWRAAEMAETTEFTNGTAPSIWMETADHRATPSWGRFEEARLFRQQQTLLIREGRYLDALKMDVDFIRHRFGNKYDGAIDKMGQYIWQSAQ